MTPVDDGGGAERRREPRHETRIDVDVHAEGTFLFAQITDISSMGIFVHADRVPPPGTLLTLKFGRPAHLPAEAGGPAPDAPPFELRGEVVWTTERHGNRAAGMGVRFVELPAEDRARLLELIHAIAYFDD